MFYKCLQLCTSVSPSLTETRGSLWGAKTAFKCFPPSDIKRFPLSSRSAARSSADMYLQMLHNHTPRFNAINKQRICILDWAIAIQWGSSLNLTVSEPWSSLLLSSSHYRPMDYVLSWVDDVHWLYQLMIIHLFFSDSRGAQTLWRLDIAAPRTCEKAHPASINFNYSGYKRSQSLHTHANELGASSIKSTGLLRTSEHVFSSSAQNKHHDVQQVLRGVALSEFPWSGQKQHKISWSSRNSCWRSREGPGFTYQ